MASARVRRVLGLLVLVLFGFLAVNSLLVGLTLDGKESPDVQCTRAGARPDVGGPFVENTVIHGDRTIIPLGVNCTYDALGDAVGPQTVVNSNWPATLLWLSSSALALGGATLAMDPQAFRRRIPDAAS